MIVLASGVATVNGISHHETVQLGCLKIKVQKGIISTTFVPYDLHTNIKTSNFDDVSEECCEMAGAEVTFREEQ